MSDRRSSSALTPSASARAGMCSMCGTIGPWTTYGTMGGIVALLGYEGRPPADLYAAARRDLDAYPAVEVSKMRWSRVPATRARSSFAWATVHDIVPGGCCSLPAWTTRSQLSQASRGGGVGRCFMALLSWLGDAGSEPRGARLGRKPVCVMRCCFASGASRSRCTRTVPPMSSKRTSSVFKALVSSWTSGKLSSARPERIDDGGGIR